MNCQVNIVIHHSPDWNPTIADPAGLLIGTATIAQCGRPAVARGKIGGFLCAEHAKDYPFTLSPVMPLIREISESEIVE